VTTEARDHQAGRATATVPELRAAALAETTFVDIALVPTGTFHGVASLQNAGNHQSTVVYCQGTSYVAVTDLNGDYVMRDVPAGAYTLIATHGGWLDGSAGGAIAAAGDSVEVAGITLLRENNMPPMVSITSPVDGANVSQLMASFTSVASDLDGSIVLYEWDFEDDGVFEYSGPAKHDLQPLRRPGDYRVKVRVTDDRGAIGLAVVRFTAVEDIYVSAATGSDINDGSRAAPVATINRGFDLAQAAGMPLVLIAAGTYNENVTLRDSVSVIGGLDGIDWTRGAGDRSTVVANTPSTAQLNVNSATITGLAFVAPAASFPGAPSIGLWLASCVDLAFNDCAFTSGAGADGAAIAAAGNGNAGATGNPGQNGSPNNSGGGAGGSGAATYGTGGGGGTGGFNGNGSTGAAASGGANGGTGGLAANSCAAFGGTGGNGNPGSAGNPGSNGSGTPSTVGSVFGISWVSSNGGNGSTGFPGFGGGGGGGGGSGYDQTLSCSADRGGGGGGGGGRRPGRQRRPGRRRRRRLAGRVPLQQFADLQRGLRIHLRPRRRRQCRRQWRPGRRRWHRRLRRRRRGPQRRGRLWGSGRRRRWRRRWPGRTGRAVDLPLQGRHVGAGPVGHAEHGHGPAGQRRQRRSSRRRRSGGGGGTGGNGAGHLPVAKVRSFRGNEARGPAGMPIPTGPALDSGIPGNQSVAASSKSRYAPSTSCAGAMPSSPINTRASASPTSAVSSSRSTTSSSRNSPRPSTRSRCTRVRPTR
jgi:hypothetical protein